MIGPCLVQARPPSAISAHAVQLRHVSADAPQRMLPLLSVIGLFFAGPVSPAGSMSGADQLRPASATLKIKARPRGHGWPGLVEEPDDARRIAEQHGIPERHAGRVDELDWRAPTGAVVTTEPDGDIRMAFVCATEPGGQERSRRRLDAGRGVTRGIIGTRSKNRPRLQHDRLVIPRVI